MKNPEVFTLDDMRHWRAPAPLQLAVLGDPVAHSASPPMHTAALEACGLAHQYGRLHVKPEELQEALVLMKRNGFTGANLTIPHKTTVVPFLNHVDPHAAIMGAVNTIVFKDNGIEGFNTDGKGLVRAIQEDFGTSLGDLRVLILGAGGGAGRAVALQCSLEGCPEITLVNRTVAKVTDLTNEIQALGLRGRRAPKLNALSTDAPDLPSRVKATDLIIQCSSLGMSEGDPSPLNREWLHSGLLVYDSIYSRETQLIQDAKTAGAKPSNGLSMLLHQGALAFEVWFQRPAPVEKMREALLQHRAAGTH